MNADARSTSPCQLRLTRREALVAPSAALLALSLPPADALADDGEQFVMVDGWVLRRDDLAR